MPTYLPAEIACLPAPNCADCLAVKGEDARVVWVKGDKRGSVQHSHLCHKHDRHLALRIRTEGIEDLSSPLDWREIKAQLETQTDGN